MNSRPRRSTSSSGPQDPAEYIANALNPARVISVFVSDSEKAARVIVPDNQLSLAIGKEGQNARLAAKLTGWKIDIKSQSPKWKRTIERMPQEQAEAGPARSEMRGNRMPSRRERYPCACAWAAGK